MYADRIRELAPAHDPRHIEAYMRDARGTLDGLDPHAFRVEVEEAKACVDADPELAEQLAQTYGLKKAD